MAHARTARTVRSACCRSRSMRAKLGVRALSECATRGPHQRVVRRSMLPRNVDELVKLCPASDIRLREASAVRDGRVRDERTNQAVGFVHRRVTGSYRSRSAVGFHGLRASRSRGRSGELGNWGSDPRSSLRDPACTQSRLVAPLQHGRGLLRQAGSPRGVIGRQPPERP